MIANYPTILWNKRLIIARMRAISWVKKVSLLVDDVQINWTGHDFDIAMLEQPDSSKALHSSYCSCRTQFPSIGGHGPIGVAQPICTGQDSAIEILVQPAVTKSTHSSYCSWSTQLPSTGGHNGRWHENCTGHDSNVRISVHPAFTSETHSSYWACKTQLPSIGGHSCGCASIIHHVDVANSTNATFTILDRKCGISERHLSNLKSKCSRLCDVRSSLWLLRWQRQPDPTPGICCWSCNVDSRIEQVPFYVWQKLRNSNTMPF